MKEYSPQSMEVDLLGNVTEQQLFKNEPSVEKDEMFEEALEF